MKKILKIASYPLTVLFIIAVVWGLYIFFSKPTDSQQTREIIQLPLSIDQKNRQTFSVQANKLPEFTLDLKTKVQQIIQASLVHEVYASEEVEVQTALDSEKTKLVVHPKDAPHFKPGKYKLHLELRTLEGLVNIEQDFTWGVIAVNTNKSIYKPGDAAHISMGVLNDNGETHCMTGEKSAKVWLTITDPHGEVKKYATEDGTIQDSGECSAISVTNKADFQALFLVATPGIHQMKVISEIEGERREIEDYFKVEQQPAFDVERYSFPTRIYPHAPYNVIFKITAQNDYRGTVEDIVPANFRISKIGQNGKEEKFGEFKKLIWNVDLKKGKTQEFTYAINFPLISPEFYLLGPIKIGDFKEARQWQIASDAINSTSGVVTYEDNGLSATWYRVWSGTAFSSESNMDTSPADSRWFVEKSSPKTGEKLVAAFDNNNDGNRIIYMFRWNGSSWAEDFTVDPATNWPNGATRMMDIAYEENSGDALFVYGDSSGNSVSYRRKANGSTTWSSAAVAGTAMDSRKKWVKAKSQFRSDNILVGYLNDNELIGALIWDGETNTFTNQFDDDNTPVQTAAVTSDEEAFDIAWETQSGTAMIFWGTAANTVLAREFSGGAWGGETTVYNSGFSGDVEWITASADPVSSSNYIALAMQESDSDTTEEVSDCEFGMWDGSAGLTRPTAISCRSDFDGRIISTAFENTGSRAVWFYGPSESGVTGNTPAYRTWTFSTGTATDWTASSALTGDLSGNIESIQLHTDLNTTSMIGLTADSAGDLNHFEWDGTSWTAVATDLHSNIQGSGEDAEAYGFGFDRNLETMAAYTWFTNANSVTPGAALAAQDSPFTLTEEKQQFRLRLLLYYPDSLASSGRNYRLQFVDPGSGTCDEPTGGTPSTWTDVGAPLSGTAISYYNNTTPGDGDNISNTTGDPTYLGKTILNQDYEEGNTSLTFTNSVSAMPGDQVGKWDFSLVDNTTFDATTSTFCFRVVRDSNNLVLQIATYPRITTAALNDVLIQGGSFIQGGTKLQ